ncbi:MAG: hypothetical protein ACOCXM_09775 [Myxococcota bacterium]
MNEPLPDVHQAVLDGAGLDDLLRDVELAAELLGVTVKGGAHVHADEGEIPLSDARELLLDGAVRGMQLRYRFEGAEWWDTILRTPGGFRVVRIRHDFG